MEEKSKNNKLNPPNELLRFYRSYFIDYWDVKYKFLIYKIENFEKQKKSLSEISGFSVIPNNENKFLSMLKYDLHFMKFQIIETVFSFIFALETGDDINLWFNLSFPKDSSERSFAAYDRISKLSNRIEMQKFLTNKLEINDSIPLWERILFYKVDLSKENKDIRKIEENLITLLNELASIFSDRDDYNAYKHSLRFIGSSIALSMKPQGANEYTPFGFAKDGMNFLTKDEKDNNIIINSTFKAFSIKEDSYYIEKSINLLKNIVNTRGSHFFNEKIKEIFFFEDIQKDFQQDYTITKFSVSTTSLNILYSKGLELVSSGDIKNAISFFEKVLQIDESHYESIFEIGFCFLSIENYDKAITYFKKYVKNNAAEYWKYALFNLALCYFKKSDFESAEKLLVQYLNSFLDINNKLTNSVLYLLSDVLLNLNQIYFTQNQKNNSNYLRRIEKSLKDAEVFEFSHPDTWFRFAFIKECMNKFDESKLIYEKIITKYPDSPNTFLNLSRIYFNEGNLEKAEKLLNKAFLIDNKKPNVWNGIASLREKQGRKEDFFDACKKSLEYSSNDEEKKIGLNNLGSYYLLIDDYNKASEYFQKALEIDQSFDNSISGLVKCYWYLKKYNEIIKLTEKLTYNSNNAVSLKFTAYSLSEIGDFENAMKILDRLIPTIESNNKFLTDLYDTKGDVFRKKGDLEKAIEFYQKSLDISEIEYEFTAETKRKIEECRLKLSKR